MDINSFNRVCIVGFAKTGVSLAELLLSLKKTVKVTDLRQEESFDPVLIDKFRQKGVEFDFKANNQEFVKDCELIVLSPGVDTYNCFFIEAANKLKIPCVGEIELCCWLTKAKIVAVTGTNGKTTTTHLAYQVLKQISRSVFIGGNIGIPFSSFVLDAKEGDVVVLEVSSFQLETIVSFRPAVAAVLNIEPDHLDRYPDFESYFKAKLNIFKNQGPDDRALFNKNINLSQAFKKNLKAKVTYFSDEFPDENFSCVYRIAQVFGLTKADCLKTFAAFSGLPHRIQFVRKIGKVSFINDSKATNPASTVWALKNIKGPIVLLAGGKDKGLEYSLISPFLRRVKKLNLIGQAAPRIKESLGLKIKTETFLSLKEAVLASYREAESGATVLFSPMCSSFDMFSDYQARGDKFIEIVSNLQAGCKI